MLFIRKNLPTFGGDNRPSKLKIMEKLSFKKLPDIKDVNIEEDLRFDIPKGRIKFLCRALYDNLFVFPKANILYAVLLVLAAVSDLLNSEFQRLPIALMIVLILKGALVFLVNSQYSSFKGSGIFPVISRDGIALVAAYTEGGRYIVMSRARWIHIEAIRFYSDFISVRIQDRKDIKDGGRLFYIMVEDALRFKDEIAYLWAEALKDPEEKTGLMLYSENEEKEITDYITEHFGSFENVLHEIASPDVHLDIAMIPASEGRNHITLCTIGAGACPMYIDEETRINYGLPDRAEYVIYLPADWKINNGSLKDERNYWPFRLLKDTARLPIWTVSWLGYGHTISPAEGELLTEDMPYDSVLLTYPVPELDTMQNADLSSGKSVCFYLIHPLTPDELDYKKENGTSDLLDQIYPENCNVMEVLLDRMKP